MPILFKFLLWKSKFSRLDGILKTQSETQRIRTNSNKKPSVWIRSKLIFEHKIGIPIACVTTFEKYFENLDIDCQISRLEGILKTQSETQRI